MTPRFPSIPLEKQIFKHAKLIFMNMQTTNRFPLLVILLLTAVLGTQCESPEENMRKSDTVLDDTDSIGTDSTEVSQTDSTDVDTDDDELTSLGCSDCDFVVTEHSFDGEALGVQPGDVIGLSGNLTYGALKFVNIVGTPENPVIIKNCDGTAIIETSNSAYGMKFQHSKYFKLMGNGSGNPDDFGIKVTTHKGFYIIMEKFTTDFEMAHIEVAGASRYGMGENSGFAAIGIKTSPYQACDVFADPSRTAWVMRNISVHDNYIHDVGGEGIYMGHGFYKGRREEGCSMVTYSHSIKGVRIYNNLIEDVGFDGIQIKNADEDVEVYNNIIRNYGTHNHGAHNEGLLIGDGTVGRFYNNLVDTGTGSGCFIHGMGDLYIYNNVFANQTEDGIYASHGPMVIRKPGAPFNIFNNTIYNAGKYGYVFHNEDGGPKRFINNLVINAAKAVHPGATTEMENNVVTNDESVIRFVDASNMDFRLNNGSQAIDAGTDLSSYDISDDCDGNPRPSGLGFDLGAYEF